MTKTSTHPACALVLGGSTGLLGQALCTALTKAGYTVHATSSSTFDVTDSAALEALLDTTQPSVLYNTIAYTQVDKAEEDEATAFALNRSLPCMLGRLVQTRPIRLMHFSTDFVFDGRKIGPYGVADTPAPLSVYGKSKLAGEQALLKLELENCCIIRTAWLFGPGKKNFVHTILSLCADRKIINVVHDQFGSPTYTVDLASYSIALAESGASGLFHIVNNGAASWCELAAEAVRLAQMECSVNPVPSKEYPQKAQRPAYGVLDTSSFTQATGIKPRPWSHALADYIFQEFPQD